MYFDLFVFNELPKYHVTIKISCYTMSGIARLTTPTNSKSLVRKNSKPNDVVSQVLSSKRLFRDVKIAVFGLCSYIYNKHLRWDFTISQ